MKFGKILGIAIGAIFLGGLLSRPSKAEMKVNILDLPSKTEYKYIEAENGFIDLKVKSLQDADKVFAQIFSNREYKLYYAPIMNPWKIERPALPNQQLFQSPWMIIEESQGTGIIHVDATNYRYLIDEFGNETQHSTFLSVDFPDAYCLQDVLKRFPSVHSPTADHEVFSCIPKDWKVPLFSRLSASSNRGILPFEFAFAGKNVECMEHFSDIYSTIYTKIARHISTKTEGSFNSADFYNAFDCTSVD